MTQLSMLITAALLFGAAVAIEFIKPHGAVTREFIDEISDVLAAICTFCLMVAILFF